MCVCDSHTTLDLRVILSESLKSRREVLHEPAAFVVANRDTPSCCEEGEDKQEERPDKPRRHAVFVGRVSSGQRPS